MKWYKHDANAHGDAKLERVRIKYGMEGYGLYWYCLELIAQNVDQHNLTFELEHDAEIISARTGIHYERVQEMMAYMVDLRLFENNAGVITCRKMLQRLDQSMVSNPDMRLAIKQAKENHDSVMTVPDLVMPDKTRLDQTRTEQNRLEKIPPTEGADAPSLNQQVWQVGTEVIGKAATDRSFLGKLIKEHGEGSVLAALKTTQTHGTGDPKSYLRGILREPEVLATETAGLWK